jgi:hypothetical protein
MSTSNLICRKAVFDEVGRFSDLRYTHDYEFFLRLCQRFDVHVLDAPLLKYRVHATNSLKAHEADVSFEIGILLTEFLVNHGFDRACQLESREDMALVKLFNSVETGHAEKMMMVVLLAQLKKGNPSESLLRRLAQDREHVLRRACVDYLREYVDLWRSHQDGWGEWSKLNDRYLELERRHTQLNDKLNEYQRSYPYWLWRALTWPVRRFGRTKR